MARQILTYFVRNPHAADTIEGVARWRLMDELIRRRLDETLTALKWLVAEGYLIESPPRGGAATFSLNLERADEARRLLEDRSVG
jgi:hypothetical protein